MMTRISLCLAASVAFVGIAVTACTEEPAAPPTRVPTSLAPKLPDARVTGDRPAGPAEPKLCPDIDERDLAKVATCFYATTSKNGTHRFLSQASRAYVSKAVAEAGSAGPAVVTVLATEAVGGLQFGRVSLSDASPASDGGCQRGTWTRTWVLEVDGWRNVGLLKERAVSQQRCTDRKDQGCAEAAAAVLEQDPFSVESNLLIALALAQGARLPGRSPEGALREALRLNPNDSQAIGWAATLAKKPEAAAALLSRLSPSECEYREAVLEVARKLPTSPKMLSFLDAHPAAAEAPLVALLRAAALADLGRKKELKALLTEERGLSIEKYLSAQPTEVAAEWGATLALCHLAIGQPEVARRVIDNGLYRDPNSKRLRGAKKMLPPQK